MTQRPGAQNADTRCRPARPTILAAALCAFLACAAAADDEPGRAGLISVAPDTGAASSATTSAPMTYPPGSLEEALNFTPEERLLLGLVHDNDSDFENAALYVLIRRASKLPPDRETYDQADRPNPRNFWRDPAGYRGKLVAVEGEFISAKPFRASASPYWNDRDVYMVILLLPATGEYIAAITTDQPEKFNFRQPVTIAGFFYKTNIWRVDNNPGGNLPAGDPTKSLAYPVIVARMVQARAVPAESTDRYMILLGIAAGALALMVLARVYLRLRQRTVETQVMRARLAARPAQDVNDTDDSVDPDLLREVNKQPPKEK